MFGSTVLDVGIGLVLVFVVYALASSMINEQISQFLGLRANNLWDSICSLLGDRDGEGLAKDLYNNPLVRGLISKQGGYESKADEAHPADRPLPSEIPSDVFSLVLHDLFEKHQSKALPANTSQETIKQLEALKPVLAKMVGTSNLPADVDAARKNIEAWYDKAMERASGWYKRKVQVIIFLVALILATATNGDTVMIANKLWSNPGARAAAVAKASTVTKESMDDMQLNNTPEVSGLVGWTGCSKDAECLPSSVSNNPPNDFGSFLLKFFGIVTTAYAASMGAPFWFDMLQKLLKAKNDLSGKTDSGSKKRIEVKS